MIARGGGPFVAAAFVVGLILAGLIPIKRIPARLNVGYRRFSSQGVGKVIHSILYASII